MAVTIQAPLAAQLFSLGSAADVGGGSQTFKGNQQAQPRGFDTGEMAHAPQPQKKSSGGGQAGALANIAGTLASAYMGSQSGAAPTDASGNGFGLGGNVVSGDAGSAQYAGTQQGSVASLFTTPEAPLPVSNGYQDSNPYSLQYQGGKESLFNYGGSYGGASY